jgi:hypothetical protein
MLSSDENLHHLMTDLYKFHVADTDHDQKTLTPTSSICAREGVPVLNYPISITREYKSHQLI